MHVKSEPWRLMTLVEEAQRGHLAAGHAVTPWDAAQIEALWDNILNEWPIGPIVLLDVSANHEHPWHGRIGPHSAHVAASRRLVIEEGIGKLAALVWSLREPTRSMLRLVYTEEVALWGKYTLVLDIKQRRARFMSAGFDQSKYLPVYLLPESGPCLKAMSTMELTPVDREWVNQSARRLHDAKCPIYIFPDSSTKLAERMLTNIRKIGTMDCYACL